MAATREGRQILVACETEPALQFFDTASRRVTGSIEMPSPPSGLALSHDRSRLFVTCAAPESQVVIVDTIQRTVTGTIPAGHTAMSPVPSRDGKTLYVCNRFDNAVGVIDLVAGKQVDLLSVRCEPVAAALTPDERFLLVANFLPSGRSDKNHAGAVISVLDPHTGEEVTELVLPNGTGSVTDLQVSPDGRYAAVTAVVGQFKPPAAALEMRWINGNALSIIDVRELELLGSVLLDDPNRGAANPSACAWSSDSKTLVVAHAGTHEISVIDFPALLQRILDMPAPIHPKLLETLNSASREELAYATYLRFFPSPRQRIKLAKGDLGPRSVTVLSNSVCVANYFSDTLSIIDLSKAPPTVESVRLGPELPMTQERKGEFYFHDAGICYQGWQSCASCHPGEGRSDALNWDLLNDGTGNHKNTKSLLFSHVTPPAMSLGVRDTAETAVRSGLKHILSSRQPESIARSIDAYLKSLKPVPSPRLHNGKLSPDAQRGKAVFERAGCADCHSGPYFTDQKPYDVGTANKTDKPGQPFDTPTLIELWRTAPYLHDGSAATVREVITSRNPNDLHGATSWLSSKEIDEICEYLLSL